MGLYTRVRHDCECGETVEWQTKAGWRIMEWGDWDLNAVPTEVAIDLNDEVRTCECGKLYKIIMSPKNYDLVRMEIKQL